MTALFDKLPEFPPALPQNELQMLAALPDWPTTTEVFDENRATARRLEKRGLIKIQRHKMDPTEVWPTWFAGKLTAAGLRAAVSSTHRDEK